MAVLLQNSFIIEGLFFLLMAFELPSSFVGF